MKTILTTSISLLLYLLPAVSWAQFVTVSGYINDNSNGKALENVSIFEANSGIGTITNQNGFYRLVLNDSKVNLKITSNGFKPLVKEMEIVSDTTFVLNLEPKLFSKKDQKKEPVLHAEASPNSKKSDKQKPDSK